MKLQELKEIIEQLEDAGVDEDREILIVYQPSWPLQCRVEGVWLPEKHEGIEEGRINKACINKDGDPYIYLVAGNQVYDYPYGPGTAFENVGNL